MRPLLFFGILCPLITAPLSGQEIIGLEFFDGEIYSIDPHSGQATQIGSTTVHNYLWAWNSFAKDGSNRFFGGYIDLFAYSGTEIYEINPITGQCVFIVKVSLPVVVALAFGPGDVLYALSEHVPGSGGTLLDLYTVDLVTGTTSLVGDTGYSNIDSLVYEQGSLWTYSGSYGLMRIDPNTALTTDVNPGFRGPSDFREGLCFSDDGVLYQVDAGFWIQDTLAGVPTFVGPLNFPGIFGGIEYLQGPTSPFTLGTLGKTNGPMGLQVWSATPLGTVAVLMAQGTGGPSSVPTGKPCAGTLINLNSSLAPLVILRANAAGRSSYGPVFVPAAAARTTHLQALDLASCTTSNPAQIIY